MTCPNCGSEIRAHTQDERVVCMEALRDLFTEGEQAPPPRNDPEVLKWGEPVDQPKSRWGFWR